MVQVAALVAGALAFVVASDQNSYLAVAVNRCREDLVLIRTVQPNAIARVAVDAAVADSVHVRRRQNHAVSRVLYRIAIQDAVVAAACALGADASRTTCSPSFPR